MGKKENSFIMEKKILLTGKKLKTLRKKLLALADKEKREREREISSEKGCEGGREYGRRERVKKHKKGRE